MFNFSISNYVVPNVSETFAIKLFDWTKFSPTNTTLALYLTKIAVKSSNVSMLNDLLLYSCTGSEVGGSLNMRMGDIIITRILVPGFKCVLPNYFRCSVCEFHREMLNFAIRVV